MSALLPQEPLPSIEEVRKWSDLKFRDWWPKINGVRSSEYPPEFRAACYERFNRTSPYDPKRLEREQASIERGASALDKLTAQKPISISSGISKDTGLAPRPLQRKISDPTPFPVEVLGEVLAPAVHKMAESIQAPKAICANSILAGLSLATQAHANVVIDGREFPLSEFFLSIGETGERKSAVDKVALWPHRQYQDELLTAYNTRFPSFKLSEEAYERAKQDAMSGKNNKGYEAKKKALADLGDPPRLPLEPHLICDEPTYEGLVKMLTHGQPSIGLFSDEGGRFIGGHAMNKDNLLKTAAGLSGLWDGKHISRVRAGDGRTLLRGRRVSFHLMAQPDVSRLMLSNAILLEQGLLSRCLVTWPTSTAGTRFYREIDLSHSNELKDYSGRILAILRTEKPHGENAENELKPRAIPLAQDAKRIWIAFHDKIEGQLKDGCELSQIRGLANKAPEHAARLASQLAVFNDINCSGVSLEWMKAGIALTTHYINEALRLFDSGVADPQIVQASKLLSWLKDKDVVSLVETYQQGPTSVRTAAAARNLMRILGEHGYVIPEAVGVEYAGVWRQEAWKVIR